MTRKNKQQLATEIDALAEETPTDDTDADPETLGWLHAYFDLSPEDVRETAADCGIPADELLEEYNRHRDEEGCYVAPE